ncbi:MAG TPA: hypoxanthine phosphoribosyltransferase [Candidatus Bathyarchaeia archaeon]|nr:hypoxanthine phosphoribosyltransferase [Candidatus Bathyarchaeia archaeon]
MPAGGDVLGEILVERDAIRSDVARLAGRISADYQGRPVHLIGVLKGSTVFLSDLMRALTVPVTVDFISVGAYGQGPVSSSGVVRIRKDLDEPIEGRDVVVVEGICASGRTLAYLLRNFHTRNPGSIRVCALLAKQCARAPELTLDYVGREIPDVFVVGYGLDKDERFRNLPHVVRLG